MGLEWLCRGYPEWETEAVRDVGRVHRNPDLVLTEQLKYTELLEGERWV